MGEERSIVESGQTRTSKKGDSIPNAPSAEPLIIIVHTFLPLEERDVKKQNAGAWNREGDYLPEERKKKGG